MSDKASLRRELRHRRNGLPQVRRSAAETWVNQQLIQLINEQRASRVAVYLAIAGELSLAPLIAWLHQQELSVYLPVIDYPSTGAMAFVRYRPDTRLEPAALGLRQPQPHQCLEPQQLDVVCLPMLGFYDKVRLGWGRGYYDKCFAFRQLQPVPPLLVGVAFACQQHQKVQPQPWDVALDVVVTEAGGDSAHRG